MRLDIKKVYNIDKRGVYKNQTPTLENWAPVYTFRIPLLTTIGNNRNSENICICSFLHTGFEATNITPLLFMLPMPRTIISMNCVKLFIYKIQLCAKHIPK